jgi:hypothetical protein
VSVIYILANVYLAVVPLFDMLLPESDRCGCGCFINYFWIGGNFDYRCDDYDFDFCL